MTRAAVGASEDQAAGPRRICEREFLRDHPAHRDSENMRARRLRVIQNRGDIRGHLCEPELGVRLVAFAGAAVVDHENLEARFHLFQERLAPSASRAAESHDKRDWFAGAANLVANLYAIRGLRKVTYCHVESSLRKLALGQSQYSLAYDVVLDLICP